MHPVGKNGECWRDKSDDTYSNNFSLNGLTRTSKLAVTEEGMVSISLRPCNKLW
jgi:hypothetical protein